MGVSGVCVKGLVEGGVAHLAGAACLRTDSAYGTFGRLPLELSEAWVEQLRSHIAPLLQLV
jgi:hypothetical protein